MILAGSEDGSLYGWDLNSQRLQIKLPVIRSPHENHEKQLDADQQKNQFMESDNTVLIPVTIRQYLILIMRNIMKFSPCAAAGGNFEFLTFFRRQACQR